MSTFLYADELERLTGYKRPAYQVRWLRAEGWPHSVNAAGLPVVLRAEAEARLLTPRPKPCARPRLELVNAKD